MYFYLPLIIISAFGASLLVTPRIRNFLLSLNLGDMPDGGRKLHNNLTPNLGGLAIFSGFIFGFAVISSFDVGFYKYLSFNYSWFFLSISLVLIAGILDDVYGVSFRQKFIVQITAATLVVVMNKLTVNAIKEPLSGNLIFLNDQFGLIFSVLWIVGISNAINLIDGMDGLAGGVSIIICLTMGSIAFFTDDINAAIVYASLIGAILGFLKYNMSPASIFMGDTGSLFIGFSIGYLTLKFRPSLDSSFGILPPFVALMFPILDTILAPTRRIISGQHPFSPDRDHIHHRISSRLNLSDSGTVFYIYGICFIFGVMAFSAAIYPSLTYIIFLLSHLLVFMIVYRLGYVTDIKKSLLFRWLTYRRKHPLRKNL